MTKNSGGVMHVIEGREGESKGLGEGQVEEMKPKNPSQDGSISSVPPDAKFPRSQSAACFRSQSQHETG